MIDEIKTSIEKAIPGAKADVAMGAGAGHYTVAVTCAVFMGKSMVESHQLVYSAIAHLMKGEQAPVHAIDKLTTKAA